MMNERHHKPAALRVLALVLVLSLLLGAALAPATVAAAGPVTVEGYSSGLGAANASSVTFAHTTGNGVNRLLLVGVAWNCGSTDRTISSVVFDDGDQQLMLGEVVTTKGDSTTAPRYAAIYHLVNPPASTAGEVTVTFSGTVSNGIVAGAANFANVDQTTPLEQPAGAKSVTNNTAPTLTIATPGGDELVFDTLFMGGSSSSQTVSAGAGQTQLWNDFSVNNRSAASYEQSTGDTVTMSWTAATEAVWVLSAVPINPAGGVTYDLTMAVSPGSGGSTTPTEGVHTYAEGTVVAVSATANPGFSFTGWSGPVADPSLAATTVTMDADKTVTANFAADAYTLTANTAGSGTVDVDPEQTTYAYGDEVTLTANPADGWFFGGWSGDLAGGENPVDLIMHGDRTVTANFVQWVPGVGVLVDGEPSSATGAVNDSSLSFEHTTGNGPDRLMLVGVSWNCGSTARTISTVEFAYGVDSTMPLTLVKTEQTGTQLRYTAIYSLLAPPTGTRGTVRINFSGAVSNGMVAGAVNFCNVDQASPLGTATGANGNDTAANVALTGLDGDELVFDVLFQGATDVNQTVEAGPEQNQLWNNWVSNTRAAASLKDATGDTLTMSWTADSGSYWALAAVPIHPTPEGNLAPVVGDIPSQFTEVGSFAPINLDDYVADPDNDDSELVWSYSGNTALVVEISAGRVATVSLPNPDWTGEETITFRATDPGALYDEDEATFTVPAPVYLLGDANGDGVVNSSDALLVLSCDAGIDTSDYCPMNCGDVDENGMVDSTDALIILAYDAGLEPPFDVGLPGCPASVTPCPGCSVGPAGASGALLPAADISDDVYHWQ